MSNLTKKEILTLIRSYKKENCKPHSRMRKADLIKLAEDFNIPIPKGKVVRSKKKPIIASQPIQMEVVKIPPKKKIKLKVRKPEPKKKIKLKVRKPEPKKKPTIAPQPIKMEVVKIPPKKKIKLKVRKPEPKKKIKLKVKKKGISEDEELLLKLDEVMEIMEKAGKRRDIGLKELDNIYTSIFVKFIKPNNLKLDSILSNERKEEILKLNKKISSKLDRLIRKEKKESIEKDDRSINEEELKEMIWNAYDKLEEAYNDENITYDELREAFVNLRTIIQKYNNILRIPGFFEKEDIRKVNNLINDVGLKEDRLLKNPNYLKEHKIKKKEISKYRIALENAYKNKNITYEELRDKYNEFANIMEKYYLEINEEALFSKKEVAELNKFLAKVREKKNKLKNK